MIAVVVGLYFISKSSFGLILRSIGENETASEGSGINTTYFKVVAFMISAGIAGLAGTMYAHAQMHVGPEMAHDSLSALVLMMAVVGGMGSIIGPIIGRVSPHPGERVAPLHGRAAPAHLQRRGRGGDLLSPPGGSWKSFRRSASA